ncbi:uncharacterized protein LOC129340289 [Eublepharis macularius]|uniref:Uncharacterized protein LOC129340289 n=1 Tax=Eublepharis macularius TaxID=481883 RepID=A0AA97K772_EUBMA|nr:uncharacterized protein LOC129340289 [Eublepharis macularius]
MADTHELIVDVLRDLTKENLRILRSILNNKALCGKTIPTSQLENVNDPYEMAEILKSYYSTDATEVLLKALEDIPRKDLAKRLHDKIKAGKVNEYEGPNDETDSQPVKRAKYDELEPYLDLYSFWKRSIN